MYWSNDFLNKNPEKCYMATARMPNSDFVNNLKALPFQNNLTERLAKGLKKLEKL